jgi:hypothetical protein
MNPPTKKLSVFRPNDGIRRSATYVVAHSAEIIRDHVDVSAPKEYEQQEFLKMIRGASAALKVSNGYLSTRAGLDKRYIDNQMSNGRPAERDEMHRLALTVVAAAKEQEEKRPIAFHTLPAPSSPPGAFRPEPIDRLLQAARHAAVMANLARRSILEIEAERPNDPGAMDRNKRLIDLLKMFAGGFDEISSLLSMDLTPANSLVKQNRAAKIARRLGEQATDWLEKNGEEMIGSTVKLSLMAVGVATLSLCGAEMKLATGLVGLAVLGKDAVSASKAAIGKIGRKKKS